MADTMGLHTSSNSGVCPMRRNSERPGFFLGEYLEAVTSGTQQCQIVGRRF